MTDQAPELLPCPFCGGEKPYLADTGATWACCESCLAEGPPCDTESEAIRLWNTRPPAERPVAQTEGCIICANGNDLPDGEHCRACGREGLATGLRAAVIKARGRQEPPTTPVRFERPAPQVREALEAAALRLAQYISSGTLFLRQPDPPRPSTELKEVDKQVIMQALRALTPVVAREPVGWREAAAQWLELKAEGHAKLGEDGSLQRSLAINHAMSIRRLVNELRDGTSPPPASAVRPVKGSELYVAWVDYVRLYGVNPGASERELSILAKLIPTGATNDASAVREALEGLNFVIEYCRSDMGYGWNPMAAFDNEGPAESYLAQQRTDEKWPWIYRIRALSSGTADESTKIIG